MKTFVLALAFFTLSPCALALDPGAGIKATPLFKTSSSWNGKALAWPEGQAEATAMVIEIAPGAETGWHKHPVPSFAVVLEGELQVTTRDGQVKTAKPGDAFAEVVELFHNGRNIGANTVKLIVFYAGAVGKPLTVREQP